MPARIVPAVAREPGLDHDGTEIPRRGDAFEADREAADRDRVAVDHLGAVGKLPAAPAGNARAAMNRVAKVGWRMA